MDEPLLSPIEQYVLDMVRAKRIEKGWSQKELAYQLDVSIGFIGDIENSKYRAKFNLNHINELAKIFECSPKGFLLDDFLLCFLFSPTVETVGYQKINGPLFKM